jgi:cytochrome c oxidase subunit 1
MSDPAMTRAAPDPAAELLTANDRRALRWQLYLALAAFGWGILAGLAQALDRVLPASSTLWQLFPGQSNYFQGLTAHGVLMVLVFTFAFINAFQVLVTARSTGQRPRAWLTWSALVVMTLGVALAGFEIVMNRASVLFTMYPPLQATPAYYFGLVLVVVSTWLMSTNVLGMDLAWRRLHRGEHLPLAAFAVTCNVVLWCIASIGVAIEVLWLLLPWSLGWLPKTDPQLARSLF